MSRYVAMIHKEPKSDFGVSFPDFPGLVTAGRSLEEAIRLAEEALAFHVGGMEEDGLGVPEPLPLEAALAEWTGPRPLYNVLIDHTGPKPKTVRVNISVPANALARIDRLAQDAGLNRSDFLVQAAELAAGKIKPRGRRKVVAEAEAARQRSTKRRKAKERRDEQEPVVTALRSRTRQLS